MKMTEREKKAERPKGKAKQQATAPETPLEPTFKADGKTYKQSEIVKVLRDLGGKDLDSTAIRDALKLNKETGRDRVRSITRQLQKAGVVVIEKKALEQGKRERYYYSLAEAEGL